MLFGVAPVRPQSSANVSDDPSSWVNCARNQLRRRHVDNELAGASWQVPTQAVPWPPAPGGRQ